MTEEVSRPKTCVGCLTGSDWDCVCAEQAVTCERKQQLWDSGYALCSRSVKRTALLLAAEAVQEERHKAERAASNPAILPGEITRLWLEALAKQFRLAEDDLRARADLELPVTTEPYTQRIAAHTHEAIFTRTTQRNGRIQECACGAGRGEYRGQWTEWIGGQ